MASYYKDSEGRNVDGPNAQTWIETVPFALMRHIVANDIPAAAGTPPAGLLSKDSVPNLEYVNGDTDSAWRLQFASSGTTAIGFQIPLREDIDSSQPIYVKMEALMGGTDDSLVVATDAFFGQGDTKVEANSGTVSGTVGADYTVTLPAASIPIGARSVSIELTPGAHTTDTFEMYSCWVKYTLKA